MTANEISNQVALARLVPYAPGRFIALPPLATLEVLEQPRATGVPGAAAHAIGLLAWRDRHIALVDLAPLLHGTGARLRDGAVPYALVVAFQHAPGEAHDYAAIALDALPQSVRVGDGDACELPVSSGPSFQRKLESTGNAHGPGVDPCFRRDDGVREVAAGCFLHEGQPVPIVDVARLFEAAAGSAQAESCAPAGGSRQA